MHVRIFQEPKNAMQSGKARAGSWVLEFETSAAQRPDPLTGWAGSADTKRQLSLRFDSAEAAQAYAERQGFACTVVPARPHRLKLQAYADNFK